MSAVMESKPVSQAGSADRSIREIIASARSRQAPHIERPGSLGAWALSLATAVLLWTIFTPMEWAPLAWIALVPMLLLIRLPQPTRWMYGALFLTGLGNQVATLQWMRLGDPTMYIAMAALATYCALYFPLFVGLGRFAVHRLGVPLVITAPVLWTGLDYARAHLMTGYAWYFLGHSQYQWLELIQVSDVTGAYGVTFVLMMCNAAVAGLVPVRWLAWLRLLTTEKAAELSMVSVRRAFLPVTAAVLVFALVLGYGVMRRQQAEFVPGPRVALIQGNFTASLRQAQPDPEKVYVTHARLTGLSVREQPDLIIWPEGMFPAPLLETADGLTPEQLRKVAPQVDPELWTDPQIRNDLVRESQKAGAALLWGIHTIRAETDVIRHFNSAVFVTPESGLKGRYDKMHLVPFGEYLPLRDYVPFLQYFTPYRGDVGLNAGRQPETFAYRDWRFSPVICFEDTVPQVVRKAVAAGSNNDTGEPVDVLVNLTNDGWFHGSSELDQHLITAAFRAVECRTPMIRAVNTGISAIIDGDGAILEPEVFIDGDWRKDSPNPPRKTSRDPQTGKRYRQMTAALVHTVPLDPRRSLYVRFGDWFAGLCTVGVAATLALGAWDRRTRRRASSDPLKDSASRLT